MTKRLTLIALTLSLFATVTLISTQNQGDPTLTEVWEPIPAVITPGDWTSAPSDAIQLFDGTIIQAYLPSAKIKFEYDSNPRGYFEEGNIVVHTTNSMGFRGKEFTVDRINNKKKIIFLGDSFTFGEGVKDKDTFAIQTVNKLNERE